jgi:dephospho-CoA kinase
VITPLQVGITGGIGSGKSLVCRIFSCLGVPIYDADSRAKSIMTTDGILISEIKKEFGVLAYHPDGSLNREYLGKLAFDNPQRLHTLNKLVHPRVGMDYTNWLNEQITSRYVIKEAALLIETGSYQSLDKIIVVHTPEALRINRVLQRDPHRDRNQVQEIMRNQLKDEEKIKLADFVIKNDETSLVIPQVLELHERFIQLN